MGIDEYYNDSECNEELLEEEIHQIEKEYEQWSDDMNFSKNYIMKVDEISNNNLKNIDKMRELIGSRDEYLEDILNQKENLLNKIRKENNDFMDKLDYEEMYSRKKYEERINAVYTKINER